MAIVMFNYYALLTLSRRIPGKNPQTSNDVLRATTLVWNIYADEHVPRVFFSKMAWSSVYFSVIQRSAVNHFIFNTFETQLTSTHRIIAKYRVHTLVYWFDSFNDILWTKSEFTKTGFQATQHNWTTRHESCWYRTKIRVSNVSLKYMHLLNKTFVTPLSF